MVALIFNASDVDPSTGGQDIFPTGMYKFMLVKSEVVQTKSGGAMLVFDAKCQDEAQAGKVLKIRLNVQNSNPQAVEIAYRDLSAICHVCGVLSITDTQQLHGKPFCIKVEESTYIKQDGSEGESNDIKGFFDAQGNPPQKGVAQSAGAAPAAPVAPAAPAVPAAPAAPAAPTAPAAPGAAAPPWGATPADPAAPGGVPPWQRQ